MESGRDNMANRYLMKETCSEEDVDIAKKYIRTVVHRGSELERNELYAFMIDSIQFLMNAEILRNEAIEEKLIG